MALLILSKVATKIVATFARTLASFSRREKNWRWPLWKRGEGSSYIGIFGSCVQSTWPSNYQLLTVFEWGKCKNFPVSSVTLAMQRQWLDSSQEQERLSQQLLWPQVYTRIDCNAVFWGTTTTMGIHWLQYLAVQSSDHQSISMFKVVQFRW